jgi:IMP dehydrogenase/GMP reductase
MVQVDDGLVATDTGVLVVPEASDVLLAGVVEVRVGVAALT